MILAGVALLRRGRVAGPDGPRASAEPGRRRTRAWPRLIEGPDGAAPPVPPLEPGRPPLAILVDYDGTIALTDVSDTVMAEYVAGGWEAEAAAYDAGLIGSRRLMDARDGDGRRGPGRPLRDRRRPAPRPGVRCRSSGGPRRPASRSRSSPTASASSSEPALEALGVGELPVVTARTTFAGRRASIELPQRQPALPRVRDVQAQPRARAPGRRPAVVFIGDGESDRYAAGYSDVVFAKRSLVRICLEAGWPFQRWTEFAEIDAWLAETLAAWRADPSSLPAPVGAAVLLRPGGLGRGPDRSRAGGVAAALRSRPDLDRGQPVIERDDRGNVDWLRAIEGPQHDDRAGVRPVEDLEVHVRVLEGSLRAR